MTVKFISQSFMLYDAEIDMVEGSRIYPCIPLTDIVHKDMWYDITFVHSLVIERPTDLPPYIKVII